MPEIGSIEHSFSLDVGYLKEGAHSLIIPINARLHELIGSIVVQWGHFELIINDLIIRMHHNISKEAPTGWQQGSFRRKRELFKSIVKEYCPKVG